MAGVTEERVCHHDLMLGILNLVEGVVIKYERSKNLRVVLLEDFKYGLETGYLVERDIDLPEGLAASERVQVRYGALRARKCLKKRAVAEGKLLQICILIKVQHFELREAEVPREISNLIDVEVEL